LNINSNNTLTLIANVVKASLAGMNEGWNQSLDRLEKLLA
jgi:hypothetical protein